MSELLTVPEAARRLGMNRKKLLRLIKAAENRSSRKIAIRIRGKCRTALRVTWPALRRYIPELFEGGGLDKLEALMRGHLQEIDRRIDERSEEVCRRVIAPIRRELEDRDERVAGMVIELAERVNQLGKNEPNSADSCHSEKQA